MLWGMATDKTIVTLEELARHLDLSRRWLKQEVRAKRLPYLKAGGRKLFNVEAVQRVLAARAGEEGGVK